jgi:hypothetical protein
MQTGDLGWKVTPWAFVIYRTQQWNIPDRADQIQEDDELAP